MTYQVLARKWRPRAFEELVGQQHVVTALVNALETKRLHHAYLFTGTRGTGKTKRCFHCLSECSMPLSKAVSSVISNGIMKMAQI
jgi:replication-associated recombination protein RarA